MKLKRVYLDTSVFIAEFDKKEGKHKPLTKFLDEVKRIKNIKEVDAARMFMSEKEWRRQQSLLERQSLS